MLVGAIQVVIAGVRNEGAKGSVFLLSFLDSLVSLERPGLCGRPWPQDYRRLRAARVRAHQFPTCACRSAVQAPRVP